MNVAVITLYYNNFNYGAQLQARALCMAINSLGHHCEQITFERNRNAKTLAKVLRLPPSESLAIARDKVLYFANRTLSKSFRTAQARRIENYRSFMLDTPHTPVINGDNVNLITGEFDGFVCGSDQIWHPSSESSEMFLTFVPHGKRRVAYAASLGVDHLSDEEKKRYSALLDGFDSISVRERQAQLLIQEVTALPVELVLDPVFLLTDNQWKEIAEAPAIGNPYVFGYFVGRDSHFRREALQFCQSRGLHLVTIQHKQNKFVLGDEQFKDITANDAGPREWLGLIMHAEAVITDSFHGTAFSLLFEKPFIACTKERSEGRWGRGDRIQSLLELIGLESGLVTMEGSIQKESPVAADNAVKHTLDSLAGASLEYLEEALK